MAKKMNFRNDMKEAKTPEVSAEETERLPTEKGYTRTKRKLKGTKNNEQTLRHGKKPIEKKQSGKLKSAVVSQQLHRKIAEADEDDNIGVESATSNLSTGVFRQQRQERMLPEAPYRRLKSTETSCMTGL